MFKKRKITSSSVQIIATNNKSNSSDDDYDHQINNTTNVKHKRSFHRKGAIESTTFEGKDDASVKKEFMPEENAERGLRGGAEASFATVDTKSTYGPTRGQGLSHIRKITRIDYNPEICKDYKETGYCGYGDTCIFIHDRSNYKEGWQIEKEWEEKQKKMRERQRRQLEGLSVSSDSEYDSGAEEEPGDDLPFACFVCRTNWSDLPSGVAPVVTLCEHYFCEKCAMKSYRTDSACPTCKKPTRGVYNVADKIINRLMKEKKDKNKGDDNSSSSDESSSSSQSSDNEDVVENNDVSDVFNDLIKDVKPNLRKDEV